jgi:hypothetical protein
MGEYDSAEKDATAMAVPETEEFAAEVVRYINGRFWWMQEPPQIIAALTYLLAKLQAKHTIAV